MSSGGSGPEMRILKSRIEDGAQPFERVFRGSGSAQLNDMRGGGKGKLSR